MHTNVPLHVRYVVHMEVIGPTVVLLLRRFFTPLLSKVLNLLVNTCIFSFNAYEVSEASLLLNLYIGELSFSPTSSVVYPRILIIVFYD